MTDAYSFMAEIIMSRIRSRARDRMLLKMVSGVETQQEFFEEQLQQDIEFLLRSQWDCHDECCPCALHSRDDDKPTEVVPKPEAKYEDLSR